MKSLLTFILLAFLTGSAAADYPISVQSKQEEILKELAQEGVIDAYYVLGQFYYDRLTERPENKQKMLNNYQLAVQYGHKQALRPLGSYWLYNEADRALKDEGLTLLSMGAILGDRFARADLVLLPRMLPLPYKHIEEIFQRALQRLRLGVTIDCSLSHCIPVSDSSRIRDEKLREGAELFETNWQASGHKSLDGYLRKLIAGFTYTDTQNRMDQFMDSKNARMVAKNRRLAKEKEMRMNADWEQQAYLDRKKQRSETADKTLSYTGESDREKLQGEIIQTLEKINLHRAPDAQIQLKDVMDVLRMGY